MTTIQDQGFKIAQALQDPILANEVGLYMDRPTHEILEENLEEPSDREPEEILSELDDEAILKYVTDWINDGKVLFALEDSGYFSEEPESYLIPWLVKNTEWHPYVLKEVLSKLTRDDAIEAIGEDLINYLHSELETYINV